MQNKKYGYKGEKIAENFLIKKGYKIIEQNFTIRGGEIDLVVQKDNTIIFVEVKSSNQEISFQDYITKNKINSLKKTAQTWIYKNDNNTIEEYRFDLILIVKDKIIEHIEGFLD